MSFDPFGRSGDLARLAAEGYELELTQGGHLLVKGVPYRTPGGAVARGTVVSKVELNGDITVNPVQDHTIRFIGEAPCNGVGEVLKAIINQGDDEIETGLVVNHQFSAKPAHNVKYADYHAKITAYVALISGPAQALESEATPRTGRPCIVDNSDWPFEYVDTASGRAGIGAISGRLSDQRIGIVGLGGTGSYILDLVAKCPVQEIHLFDDDVFSTHNAFRAPGAPELAQLRSGQSKVEYLAGVYSKMKRNIIPHVQNVTADNMADLAGLSFVFLAMEGGPAKRAVVTGLETLNLPFVDTSIGVVKARSSPRLSAVVDINASTPADRDSVRRNVDFGELDDDEDPYAENIQIAELNALSAAHAVIWWKKWSEVYHVKTLHNHQHMNVGFGRLSSE